LLLAILSNLVRYDHSQCPFISGLRPKVYVLICKCRTLTCEFSQRHCQRCTCALLSQILGRWDTRWDVGYIVFKSLNLTICIKTLSFVRVQGEKMANLCVMQASSARLDPGALRPTTTVITSAKYYRSVQPFYSIHTSSPGRCESSQARTARNIRLRILS